MNDTKSEDEGVGGEEVGDEDIPIVPILIDEKDDSSKTSDDTVTSDELSEHIPEVQDEPEGEVDTTVEPLTFKIINRRKLN